MDILKDLGRYLTRPIIPFCFGIPLLLPATLLVVIAFLQDHISTTLHVMGFLLLSLSVLSIGYGITLGCHDVHSKGRPLKRPTTKGFQRVDRRKVMLLRSKSPKNSISPLSASNPSSQNSSRSSSLSDISDQCFMVTNEMVRLVPYTARKNRKSRMLGRKKNVPRKIHMPALKEEDHSTDSTETKREPTRSGKIARNFENLEKHLKEIGLGDKRAMFNNPVDVEIFPTGIGRQENAATDHIQNKTTFGDLSRSRSLPEEGFKRTMTNGDVRTQPVVVAGSVEAEEQLRSSARTARAQTQLPMMTAESHERTGIRIDMGGMFS